MTTETKRDNYIQHYKMEDNSLENIFGIWSLVPQNREEKETMMMTMAVEGVTQTGVFLRKRGSN